MEPVTIKDFSSGNEKANALRWALDDLKEAGLDIVDSYNPLYRKLYRVLKIVNREIEDNNIEELKKYLDEVEVETDHEQHYHKRNLRLLETVINFLTGNEYHSLAPQDFPGLLKYIPESKTYAMTYPDLLEAREKWYEEFSNLWYEEFSNL